MDGLGRSGPPLSQNHLLPLDREKDERMGEKVPLGCEAREPAAGTQDKPRPPCLRLCSRHGFLTWFHLFSELSLYQQRLPRTQCCAPAPPQEVRRAQRRDSEGRSLDFPNPSPPRNQIPAAPRSSSSTGCLCGSVLCWTCAQ